MKNSIFLLIAVMISSNIWAFVFGGSNLGVFGYQEHECNKPTKPYKPYSFNSQYEINSYNSEVESYNSEIQDYISCVEEYTDNANNDIRRIQEKAQEAIDEASY